MKLCKDCKHFDYPYFCKRIKKSEGISPVTGKPWGPETLIAESERERERYSDACGPNAKYFEVKPTFFERLAGLFKWLQ